MLERYIYVKMHIAFDRLTMVFAITGMLYTVLHYPANPGEQLSQHNYRGISSINDQVVYAFSTNKANCRLEG